MSVLEVDKWERNRGWPDLPARSRHAPVLGTAMPVCSSSGGSVWADPGEGWAVPRGTVPDGAAACGVGRRQPMQQRAPSATQWLPCHCSLSTGGRRNRTSVRSPLSMPLVVASARRRGKILLVGDGPHPRGEDALRASHAEVAPRVRRGAVRSAGFSLSRVFAVEKTAARAAPRSMRRQSARGGLGVGGAETQHVLARHKALLVLILIPEKRSEARELRTRDLPVSVGV
jgi:hypothetical protein